MTRKHYKIIAEAMAESKPHLYPDSMQTWKATVETLAMYLQHNNANFDKDKFLEACGYEKVWKYFYI